MTYWIENNMKWTNSVFQSFFFSSSDAIVSFSCLLSSYSFVTIYTITSLFVTIKVILYLVLGYTRYSRRKLSELISGLSIVSWKPWLVNRIKMENAKHNEIFPSTRFVSRHVASIIVQQRWPPLACIVFR